MYETEFTISEVRFLFSLFFMEYGMRLDKNLRSCFNLFRDRLRPMLKQIGVRDMQSIAGY